MKYRATYDINKIEAMHPTLPPLHTTLLTPKDVLFRVRRSLCRVKRKDTVIAGYCKALQRRYPQKKTCFKRGILECEMYMHSNLNFILS